MSSLNVKPRHVAFTHEGGRAYVHLTSEQALRRSVLSCLLWEDEFYEDGQTIADRITENALKVKPETLAALAIEARTVFNLRHVPLLLLDTLSKTASGTPLVADTVARVIQRPDEMTELLAVYWRKGRKMVPHGFQRGLARAFANFDEYQLAKYDRDGAVKLRDVLRLVRPKPKDEAQSALFKRVKERTLTTPDTWEVELSGGKAKKDTFERLLKEGKLGYLALLRNLRNMANAEVDVTLVQEAILARKGAARVFPFRYVAAARAAPQFEPYLDKALVAAINEAIKLVGTTIVLVDVSGSMDWALSKKSDLKRLDAAAALASIVPAETLRVFTFSDRLVEVAPRQGMAGVDVIRHSQPHSGTQLGAAVTLINKIKADRLIVVTDEQSHDAVPDPVIEKAYLINVASNKNGVGYGKWVHIDGFSEGVLRYIRELETV